MKKEIDRKQNEIDRNGDIYRNYRKERERLIIKEEIIRERRE